MLYVATQSTTRTIHEENEDIEEIKDSLKEIQARLDQLIELQQSKDENEEED